MNTLAALQKLSRLGKILSKIVFILSLIGGIGCLAGLAGMLFLPESIRLGSVTIKGIVEKSAEISREAFCVSLAMGLFLCAGEAVLSRLAEICFRNELAAGTPFTLSGARELIRLGICAVCIPLGCRLLAAIVWQIFAHLLGNTAEPQLGEAATVALGCMMIVAGLLCRYGAELTRTDDAQPRG